MAHKILNRKKLNPSIPIFTGIKYTESLSLQLFNYNKLECIEDSDYIQKEFNGFPQNTYQNWLNIHGLHDVKKIKNICSTLGVHDLVIQDILDVNQRPKLQDYEKYLFFTLKSIVPASNSLIEQE